MIEQGVDFFRSAGAGIQLTRQLCVIAEVLLAPDQGTEARDLLAPIHGWFTEGLDTPDLVDAKALLDELA